MAVLHMKFTDNKVWRYYVGKNLPAMRFDVFVMSEGTSGECLQRQYKEEGNVSSLPGSVVNPAPTFSMDYDEAQTLMNEMWLGGLRPNNQPNALAEVAALQEHLETCQQLITHFMALQNVGVDEDLYEQVQKLSDKVEQIIPTSPV